MDGLFFLLSIAGVVLVVYWMVVNDGVAPDKPTRGWLAMPETQKRGRRRARLGPYQPAEPPEEAPGRSRTKP